MTQLHQELVPVPALVDGGRSQPLAVAGRDILGPLRRDVSGQAEQTRSARQQSDRLAVVLRQIPWLAPWADGVAVVKPGSRPAPGSGVSGA